MDSRAASAAIDHLTALGDFGSNPGALRASYHLPDGLGRGAPLVVVLHGCTQTAAGYDLGAGWSQMADRFGFAVLFPEQQRQNNPNLCFNWFLPGDHRRDQGEALSIRQMIAATVDKHGLDRERVFITGLSAGGAMALVMLATYPEVFAGGAIVAGLPYGSATSVPQALERMRGQRMPDEAALLRLVRAASDHPGPWPTLSIWHGSADATVHPDNADAIAAQWRALHALAPEPDRTDRIDGHRRRVWRAADGREVLEDHLIAGMGHGTPIDPAGPEGCGAIGPFLLEAGISSTHHICRFWGLAKERRAGAARPSTPAPPAVRAPDLRVERPRTYRPPDDTEGVGRIIEDALRAAGLMR